MATPNNVTGTNASRESTPDVSVLLDVKAVAVMLDCSQRHIYRLADSGRMPRPLKLGALIRWRRTELLDWIADGCSSCRQRRAGGGK